MKEQNQSNRIINELDEKFNELRRSNMHAFIPFLTIGDPNPDLFLRIAEVVGAHADVVELGIPFSDPLADGPTIQKANQRALNAGIHSGNAFELIKKVKDRVKKPIVILTYANILGTGEHLERFTRKLSECGVSGVVLADVPVEELDTFKENLRKNSIHPILLATPTTTTERLKKILLNAGGFLYMVSVKGTTGARERMLEETRDMIRRIKTLRDKLIKSGIIGPLPLCLGFGISTPEHVKDAIDSGADGVIVGSAIINYVERIANTTEQDDIEGEIDKLNEFVGSLSNAAHKS